MNLQQAFGLALREARERRGISQERLGLKAGFHRTYISFLERGLRSPTLEAVFQLAAILDVSASKLVAKVEDRRPTIRKREGD